MKNITGVTDTWQKISIPLTYFNGLYDKTQQETWENPSSSLRKLDELVIVFTNARYQKERCSLF